MLEFWEPVPATAEILMERSTPRRPAPRLALLMDHSVEDPMPSLSISLAVRKSAPFVFPFYVDRHDLVLFSFFFFFFLSFFFFRCLLDWLQRHQLLLPGLCLQHAWNLF